MLDSVLAQGRAPLHQYSIANSFSLSLASSQFSISPAASLFAFGSLAMAGCDLHPLNRKASRSTAVTE
jgi:hypothetical protein